MSKSGHSGISILQSRANERKPGHRTADELLAGHGGLLASPAEQSFLPTLLGITAVDNPNQSHPLTLTQVAQRLDLPNWQAANKLLNKIKAEKGVDLRSTDNRYHCKIKTGIKDSSSTRKWSHEGVDLFKKVIAGEPYELNGGVVAPLASVS